MQGEINDYVQNGYKATNDTISLINYQFAYFLGVDESL